MIARPIVPNLYGIRYTIPTGSVNAFVLDLPDGVTLIDTGYTDDGERLYAALHEIGRSPTDVRHILVTHCHVDHAGSLAALRKATGAPVYMHPLDIPMVEAGKALRATTTSSDGPMNSLMYRVGVRLLPKTITPSLVDVPIEDAALLNIGGGIRVIHTPGHSAGQVSFLWEPRGVLFAADAAANLFGAIRFGPVTEDMQVARESALRLSTLRFDTATFGHGPAIVGNADRQFRERFKAS